jgi:chloramphenicol-sensitive protein RarD
VVWSVALLALLLLGRGGWSRVRATLADRRSFRVLAVTSVLVSVNWLTFIWGIGSGHVVECSLGYFISPLVNVVLGVALLGERLRRRQAAAVALAAVAVLLNTVALGRVPWIALVLAGSWGAYGLLRKTVRVDALEGLAVETLLLAPIALGFLVVLGTRGQGQFGVQTGITVLLACAGFVTALPLLWFVHGARRMPYSTIGLLQYLAPTLQFLLGVLAYGEPFPPLRAVSFALIWAALAVFSWDLWRATRTAADAQRTPSSTTN